MSNLFEPPKKTKSRYNEHELLDRVAKRSEHQHHLGTFIPQCGHDGRIADGIWLHYHGWMRLYEVKTSRADWLSELRDPWKSHAIGRYCAEKYLVVSDRKIVKPGELWDEWGLMAPHGDTTKILQRAKTIPETQLDPWPKTLFVDLISKIVRLPGVEIYREWMYDERRAARADGYKRGKRDAEKPVDNDFQELHDELLEKVKEFEKETGLNLTWQHEASARVAKILLQSDIIQIQEALRWGIGTLRRKADGLESDAKAIESALLTEGDIS